MGQSLCKWLENSGPSMSQIYIYIYTCYIIIYMYVIYIYINLIYDIYICVYFIETVTFLILASSVASVCYKSSLIICDVRTLELT